MGGGTPEDDMAKNKKTKPSAWFKGQPTLDQAGTITALVVYSKPLVDETAPDDWQRATWIVETRHPEDGFLPQVCYARTNVPVSVALAVPLETLSAVRRVRAGWWFDGEFKASDAKCRIIPDTRLSVTDRIKLYGTGQRVAYSDPALTPESAAGTVPVGMSLSGFAPSGVPDDA